MPTCKYICTYIHSHTYTNTNTYTHTQKFTHIPIHSHICTYANIWICICAYTYTHTHKFTHTHFVHQSSVYKYLGWLHNYLMSGSNHECLGVSGILTLGTYPRMGKQILMVAPFAVVWASFKLISIVPDLTLQQGIKPQTPPLPVYGKMFLKYQFYHILVLSDRSQSPSLKK